MVLTFFILWFVGWLVVVGGGEKALDEERLKKSNLAAENKTLQKMVADLEAKSADKSRYVQFLYMTHSTEKVWIPFY